MRAVSLNQTFESKVTESFRLHHISLRNLVIESLRRTGVTCFGMIDDQVHFWEPGPEHKGSIATESRAAVAGGITSYMEMPNVSSATTSIESLEHKFELAAVALWRTTRSI